MTCKAVAAVAILIALASPSTAAAGEVTVWTSRAIATVLAEVGAEFERTTGHRLVVTSDLPPAFLRRVQANEPFDLLISGSDPVDEWIRDGRLAAATRTEIARSGIGVEVRTGSPKPDISTVDAFKRALVNAKSIAYLKVGSGIHIDRVLSQLAVADVVQRKAVRPDSDIVSELVARGEVELGMVVITQILTTPGVDLVGPLPSALQSYVTFVAGISVHARAPDAANELIKFLLGSRAIAVIKSQGMEPGHR